MEREDARTQTLKALYERRKQVVRLKKQGIGVMEIVKLSGLSWPAVRVALDLFAKGGWKALEPQAPGRKPGTGRILAPAQEEKIKKLICDKRPEQLKMDFALWNCPAVMLLIEQEFGLKLSVRAIGNYLKRWGFIPQKPIKRAYEQSPEAVQAWLNEEYPSIAMRAKTEGAEIHWGDETALVNTDVRGRGYSPKGQTPVVYTVGGKREKFSMISTVTNQGKTRWMIIENAFNSDRLIEFLEALIKDAKRKVFLILDNLRVHHSRSVKAWLALHQAKIEVFYLPGYSPELNPDERLNADLKYAIGSKVPARTKKKLKGAADAHMTMLEQSPERVKSYFQDPLVNYAA